ncbi:MAG: hypothetical protein RJA70_2107 [Pseudomonadota bacterium]|jgi:hypothetical protein
MRFISVVSVLVFLGVSACSSDEASDKDTQSEGDKNDDSEADRDSGSAQGATDDDGPSRPNPPEEDAAVLGDAGIPPIMFFGDGVKCGDNQCQDVAVGGSIDLEVEGCCANEKRSLCGLNLKGLGPFLGLSKAGCEPLDLPGSDDDACKESSPIAAAFGPEAGLVLPGCCRENDTCGYATNISGIGFGCVDSQRFLGEKAGGKCEYRPE